MYRSATEGHLTKIYFGGGGGGRDLTMAGHLT